jgi:hypothetical protein
MGSLLQTFFTFIRTIVGGGGSKIRNEGGVLRWLRFPRDNSIPFHFHYPTFLKLTTRELNLHPGTLSTSLIYVPFDWQINERSNVSHEDFPHPQQPTQPIFPIQMNYGQRGRGRGKVMFCNVGK